MTKPDEAAFSRALKAKFPDLVFAVVEKANQAVTLIPAIDQAIETDGQPAGVAFAWVQPHGWQPKWERQDLGIGYFKDVLANKPEKCIRFLRSSGFTPRTSDGGLPIMRFATEGGMNAGYDTNNREVRSFVDAVYRLLAKFTTNKFAVVNPDTRRVVRIISGHWDWAGHDALNMCRTHRNYFIRFGGRDEQGNRCYLAPTDWCDEAT